MKKLLLISLLSVLVFQLSITHAQCPEALKSYVARYPQAQPEDLYKLVFQDLYGPGHLLTDSLAAVRYITREIEEMSDSAYPEHLHDIYDDPFPLYEYTLCDSNFVRVNLILVKRNIIPLSQLVSALLRSTEGIPSPDHRFVMSHSAPFKAAYDPHYRIVRRDIFQRELFPTIALSLSLITTPAH